MGKLKNVLSDVEVLCALEKHMPAVRALQASLVPFLGILSVWASKDLTKFDNALTRRLTVTRELVSKAFVDFSKDRIKAEKLDDFEPASTGVDIGTLFTISWATNIYSQILADADTGYAIPYQIVSARLGGKVPHSRELERLHVCYGKFTQARKRLTQTLDEVFSFICALSEHQPVVEELYNQSVEALAACTDARDAFMELKNAHQIVYERIKDRS